MPGCSAGYCTNSAAKGYQMFRFPRAEKIRRIWIKNINRLDWAPGPHAKLCHAHFSDEMWKKTSNNKRRLSKNAIPTIFHNRTVKIETFHEKDDESVELSVSAVQVLDSDDQDASKAIISLDDQTKFQFGINKDDSLPGDFNDCAEMEQENTTTNKNDGEMALVDENIHNTHEEVTRKEGTCEGGDEIQESSQKETLKIKKLEERLSTLEKFYEKSERSRITYYKQLRAAKRHIKQLEGKLQTAEEAVRSNKLRQSLTTILNEDQIKILTKHYKKIPRWCNETLINAYKLRFVCGTSGYEEILRQNFPFPSIRTLTRKLENLKFISGVAINEIFTFLKLKIASFEKDIFKDCMVVLDEMSITPGSFYDTSTNNFVGNVTLPGHDHTQTATHALVIMLAGLGARWKQVVRYDFTGDAVKGALLKPVLDDIIVKAEEIDLRIHVVTSDMGPANQAMWRAYGIKASRYSQIINSCTHPVDSTRRLYFYADSPHAYKNAKAGFLNNNVIIIPDNFVQKYSLPSNTVNSEHLSEVVEEDKNLQLKLVPNLREEYLDTSNHFQKMRVGNATRV